MSSPTHPQKIKGGMFFPINGQPHPGIHPKNAKGGMLFPSLGSPPHLRILSSITGQPNPPPPPTKKKSLGDVCPFNGQPHSLPKKQRGVPFPHREAPPTPKKKTCFPSLGSPTHPKKTKGDCFSPSLGGPIHFKTASFECLRFTVPAHPIVTLASSSGAALPYRACCLR